MLIQILRIPSVYVRFELDTIGGFVQAQPCWNQIGQWAAYGRENAQEALAGNALKRNPPDDIKSPHRARQPSAPGI